MKTLNPLGERPILDCTNVSRKKWKDYMQILLHKHDGINKIAFFFTVSNVKGVTINMNTLCLHDTISLEY